MTIYDALPSEYADKSLLMLQNKLEEYQKGLSDSPTAVLEIQRFHKNGSLL
jgi:hypothetical protein